ncbi:hypothetical protein BBJ28_00021550 [Nothophytophthora sp. Chile5]|nr:hypothetical protein BBJ28_00021550 [Nothophytophthora sp. Chile5]
MEPNGSAELAPAAAASRSPVGRSIGSGGARPHLVGFSAEEPATSAQDAGMTLQSDAKPRAISITRSSEDEEEKPRHGDATTDDEPMESTADEEEEDDDDEEEEEEDLDSDAKTEEDGNVELSDSASMLRMLQSLSEDEACRHEQFRRSHFERGAIKRCMAQAIQECSAADKKAPGVTNVMAIVMAGMTKVFVGEITAEAIAAGVAR